ncbi:MAG: transposase [Actinobacteria bacterium]|nr:transposase [Actinomycetota bacterium]
MQTHTLTDGTGVPLVVDVSAGNRHDVTRLLPLVDALRAAPIRGRIGRPRGRTDRILADRGYDYDTSLVVSRIRSPLMGTLFCLHRVVGGHAVDERSTGGSLTSYWQPFARAAGGVLLGQRQDRTRAACNPYARWRTRQITGRIPPYLDGAR